LSRFKPAKTAYHPHHPQPFFNVPVILKRTLTTLTLWAAIIASLYFFKAHAAVWIVALMAVVSVCEFNKLTRAIGSHPFHIMGMIIAGLMIAVPFYFPQLRLAAADFLVAGVLAGAIRILGERDLATRVGALASTLFALAYVPLMLSYFVQIIGTYTSAGFPYAGVLFFIWVVIVTKLCDTGALLTGMAAGKHKMTPVISPKKTWEGVVGGVITSALISALFAWLFSASLPSFFTPRFAALAALPLAALGVIGDLVESIIKRRAGIKDSGNLAPGIGGMFDMTDSLILTAPAAFWLLRLM
jgi:phosphatidate cytidylyltransferase